jgi:hypothetical protein
MRSVIGAYHKCVTETVARFDGFVAKYMGDGVLIYFGYPQAHEDDAERAVRTGLRLVEAIPKLETAASWLSLLKTVKHRENLEIFSHPRHTVGWHDHDSIRSRLPALVPRSQPRVTGA